MALDLKKMQERLSTLKNNGDSSKKHFWRPSDGEQTVRIVPTEDGDPFKDYHFHYNLGQSGFLCPKRNFGDECPVCEFATKLYREGTPESLKTAKSFFARQRFFSPVLVRGEEADGVRVWGYGKQAYESLLGLVLNPDYGDITDVEDGVDLVLTYGKPAGASFPQTKLTPRRRNSSLCDEMTPAQCTELLQNIPEFEGLFERKTTEQVTKILDEFLLSDAETEGSSSETEKYNVGNSDTNTSSNKSEERSVEAAFNELLA